MSNPAHSGLLKIGQTSKDPIVVWERGDGEVKFNG
jgi:hypothetical protein